MTHGAPATSSARRRARSPGRRGCVATVVLLYGAVAFGAPASAGAQSEGGEEVRDGTVGHGRDDGADAVRVAVLVIGTDAAAREAEDALSELLVGAVASRGGMIIVGKEELQARLGQGDDATLDCVSSSPCMGRVGVELGVRELIAGTLARRGDAWTFNLNRVDVHEGEVLARVFREVTGPIGAVADALLAAVPRLFEVDDRLPIPPAPELGALSVRGTAGAEVYVDGRLRGTLGDAAVETSHLEPGPHDVRIEAPGYEPWVRTVDTTAGELAHLEVALTPRMRELPSPWLYVAAGTALTALGVAIGLGISSQAALDLSSERRTTGQVSRHDALAFYDARANEATAANILFGLAAAAAGVAVTLIFFPDRSPAAAEEADEARALSLRLSAGALSVEGAY